MTSTTIVFFDGVCGLCNRFVDFLIQRDHRHRLRFAPLQGHTAAAFAGVPTEMNTVVAVHDGRVLTHSTAAFIVLRQLGGPWSALAGIFLIVPQGMRDALYAVVARNRYRWFGQRDACRLPSASEAEYFLP